MTEKYMFRIKILKNQIPTALEELNEDVNELGR